MVFARAWRKHALTATVVLGVGALSVASISVAAGPPPAGAEAGRSGLRQVSYRGYTFEAPGSWPVIRLAAHPSTCVRFDRHAVYLGRPAAEQACPSGLVGTAGALLVQPDSAGPGSGRPASMSAEDPVADRITISAARISVTATYHADRAQTR